MSVCKQRLVKVVPKLLVVEDDAELAGQVSDWLADQGYQVERANTGEDALQLLSNFKYDVLLLDWSLPGISGLEVLKKHRQSGGMSLALFITGKGDIDSKEMGLNFGADDYLVKPFDMRELSARLKTIMRRPQFLLPDELRIGDIMLNPSLHKLRIAEQEIRLMPKESALLEYLMRHPNRVYSSKDLLDAVWPSEKEATTDTVRSWMRNLRKKLGTAGREDFVKTIPASGYVIECDLESLSG